MRKLARVLVSTLLVAGAFAPAVRAADGNGSVAGTVVDIDRNAISEMIVKATDVVDPSKIFTSVSDKNGRYLITDVPSGSYLINADTVNTTWIQKDDSPIVEVSTSARPNVVLVLVKSSELMPPVVGDGGSTGIHMATIGVATLAAIAGITAVVNTNDLDDENDELLADNAALARQLEETEGRLNEQMLELQRQLQELTDQNSLEHDQLEDEINDLNDQIRQIRQQLQILTDQVNRIRLSSPFR